MRKGIVVDEKKKHVILMTPRGEFMKIKKGDNHYSLGQEMTFSLQSETVKTSKKPFLPFALATVMLLSVFLTYTFYQRNLDNTFAYVAIDINPSLNIEINEQLKVLNIEPFNSDGERIKSLLENWKNSDLEIVTTMILDCSKQEGFLKNDGEVLISFAFLDEEDKARNKKIETNIEKQLNHVSSEKEISITTFEVTKDMHEQAKEKMTTPNKYAIVQSAHEAGIEISIDEINNKSVKEINQEFSDIGIFKNGMKQRPEQGKGKTQDSSSGNPTEKKEAKQQNKQQEKPPQSKENTFIEKQQENERQKKGHEERGENLDKPKQNNKENEFSENPASNKERKKGKPEQEDSANNKPNQSASNGSENKNNKKPEEAKGKRDREDE